MAQQGQHHVVGLPANEVVGCPDIGGDATHEGTPQEALRTLVVEEPRQAGEQAVGECPMQEGGHWMGRFEMEVAAMQRAQFAQRCAAALHVDAVQRPAAAGTGDLVCERIAARPRAADADDALAR
jgi:hypothetical protein